MQSNLLSKGSLGVACTALVVLVLMLVSSVSAQTGATYYVSTTGKNSNPGTIDAPWLTIQHAASTVTAGATVYVIGGVYNESVSFPRSGTASAPITFQSYPGQTAVIDGTGLTVSETQGLITISGARNYITVSGFEIRNLHHRPGAGVPCGSLDHGFGHRDPDSEQPDSQHHDHQVKERQRLRPVRLRHVDRAPSRDWSSVATNSMTCKRGKRINDPEWKRDQFSSHQ